MKPKRSLVILLSFVFLLLLGKIYYETNSIEIRHYQIQNSALGEVLAGLNVAHLSDLHIKTIGVRENKILEILGEKRPDLILLTGDFIGFRSPYERAMSFLSQLKAPFGTYAVLGNTEYSNENDSCILCHVEKSPKLKDNPHPIFLRNSSATLNINGKNLNLIGLDDPVEKKGDLTAALKYCNTKNPLLLLCHSPEVFEEATQSGIDLVLSGHNHGGQFFFVKYLRKIIPLDPTLELLEGFFQNGKTLMYVSRGIGTSFLRFRLGVKPEVTFFTFSNEPDHSRSSFKITNQPAKTYFCGLSFSSFLDLFDFYPISSIASRFLMVFNALRFALCSLPCLSPSASRLTPYDSNVPRALRLATHGVLYDFESDADLERLNWECRKWFERSPDHATSGKYSLRVILPPGQYPGIDFQSIKRDWSKSRFLKMDIFNSSKEVIKFNIRIDDHKSGWDYGNRFDWEFDLKPGMNHISIPAGSIRTNDHSRNLDLKKIDRMMVFLPNNAQKRVIFIDYIRLE